MSVTVLATDESSADVKKIVSTLSELRFTDLTINLCTKGSYIKAPVLKRSMMQRTKSRSLIKVFLEQDDVEVPVFFLGRCAEDAQQVAAGDTVILSDVIVENNTQQIGRQSPWQLMVDALKSQPKVWILHKKSDSRKQGATTSAGQGVKLVKKSSIRNYNYTPLKNIKAGDVINVFGVVKYFKAPTRTRGSDFSMFISIVDNSGAEKLKCLIFARDEQSLPPITVVGQVVRFHRLKIREFNDELQGQGHSGRGFSWLVFSGDIGGSLTPKATSKTYTCTEEDHDKVLELREWAAESEDVLSQQQDHVPLLPATPGGKTSLQDCKEGQYFDLVCQVVGKCILETNCYLVKVWDGTYPSFPTKHAEIADYPHSDWMCVDEDIQADARDRVVDVFVFDNHTDKVSGIKPRDYIRLTNLHAAQPSSKSTTMNTYPQVEMTLHGRGAAYNRSLHLLDDNDPDVLVLKEQLVAAGFSDGDSSPRQPSSRHTFSNQSVSQLPQQDAMFLNPDISQGQTQGQGHQYGGYIDSNVGETSSFDSENRCMMNTATVLKSHHDQKPSILKEVVQHSVPHKFRVMVHAKDYLPKASTPQDLVKLYCEKCCYIGSIPNNKNSSAQSPLFYKQDRDVALYSCPVCKGDMADRVLEYTIMVQFLLHDSSGWITAGLWRQEAEKFCRDLTATDILSDADSFDYVKTRLERLIQPKDEAQPGPTPFLECCIQSYSSKGGVCYQIFDTVLEWTDLDRS